MQHREPFPAFPVRHRRGSRGALGMLTEQHASRQGRTHAREEEGPNFFRLSSASQNDPRPKLCLWLPSQVHQGCLADPSLVASLRDPGRPRSPRREHCGSLSRGRKGPGGFGTDNEMADLEATCQPCPADWSQLAVVGFVQFCGAPVPSDLIKHKLTVAVTAGVLPEWLTFAII